MTIEPGQKLLHYELVSRIGEGGMGVVWSAEDTVLRRAVALKFLPEAFAQNPERLARFEREARFLASLSHSNIAAIHGLEEADGERFLVLELVPGTSLDERIKKGPLPVQESLKVCCEIARALEAAHAKGVIHRDLKPGNVQLTPEGQVKVLDFGLAKAFGVATSATELAQQATVTAATGQQTVMGTTPYMSPEQASAKGLDKRTDIWAFGCILYEVLTGQRAFAGETVSSTIAAIHSQDPDWERLPVETPRGIHRLLRRCLEKDPDHRLHDIADARIEIEDVMAERASETSARPEAAPAPWARPWRVLALLVGAVVVGGVAGIFLWRSLAPAVQPNTGNLSSVAVLPFVNVGGDPETEYLSDGITESLINSLASLPGLRVVSRGSVFKYKGREFDLPDVARDLSVQAVVTGRVSQRGGTLIVSAELVNVADDSQLWGDQYGRSVADIFEVQDEIASAIAGQLRQHLSGEQKARLTRRDTQNTDAYRLYLKGRYHWNRRTDEDMRQALQYFERAIEIDPQFALAWSGVADCYATRPYLGLAPADARPRSKAAALKALQLDDTLAEAHATLADTLYMWEWDWEGADREFRHAIDLNPNYATGHQWYAELLSVMGRHDEAIAAVKKAYELDPLSIIIPHSVAKTYGFARRFDEAITWYEKGLALTSSFLPSPFHGFETGLAYLKTGEEQRAVEVWQQLLARRQQEEFSDRLGRAYAKEGISGVWRIWLELPESEDPTLLLKVVGSAQLGDHERAFQLIEQAMEQKHDWVVHIRNNPLLDPLHSDPRFDEILQRLKFPV